MGQTCEPRRLHHRIEVGWPVWSNWNFDVQYHLGIIVFIENQTYLLYSLLPSVIQLAQQQEFLCEISIAIKYANIENDKVQNKKQLTFAQSVCLRRKYVNNGLFCDKSEKK